MNPATGLREKDGRTARRRRSSSSSSGPAPAPDFEAALNQYKNDLLSIGVRMDPQSIEWAAYQKKLPGPRVRGLRSAAGPRAAGSTTSTRSGTAGRSRSPARPTTSSSATRRWTASPTRLREEMDLEEAHRDGAAHRPRSSTRSSRTASSAGATCSGSTRSDVKNVAEHASQDAPVPADLPDVGRPLTARLVFTYLLKRLLLMVPTLVGITPDHLRDHGRGAGTSRREGAGVRRGQRERGPDEGEEQGRVAAPLPPPVRPRPARLLERVDLPRRRRVGPHRRGDGRGRPGEGGHQGEAGGEGAARGLGLLRRPRPRTAARRDGGRGPARASSTGCGFSATRLPVQPYGRTLDEATVGRNAEWMAENAELARSGASAAGRPARAPRRGDRGSGRRWFEAHTGAVGLGGSARS